jgi:anthranilate phosphoribosyltransferase
MHTIAPILRRLVKRPSTQGEAAGGIDAEEAFALWGAVLDGALPELELGALLAALAAAGESPEELLGLHRALGARQARFSPSLPRRPVSIPVYGLVPGEAAYSVLLALFLRRFDVPVVLHGSLDAPEAPSVAVLLREFGVMPSASLADAERDLLVSGVAFVPVQLLSPQLGNLVALRARLGFTNAAQIAAHVMDPGSMGALRVAMTMPGTRSARLATLVAAAGGETLLLSWPVAATACSLTFRPRIALRNAGEEAVVFEAEPCERAAPAAPPSAAELVPWLRSVIERRVPAPLPLVNLAVACIHATRAATDLMQAKAIVALQSGRLAA